MSIEMKRILILGSFFPPSSMPAALRIYGFAKYLNKYGYYPVIISRKWENHGATIYDSYIQTKQNTDYIKTAEFEAFLLPYHPTYRDRLLIKHPNHPFFSLVRRFMTFAENFLNGFSDAAHSYKNIYRFADILLDSDSKFTAILSSGNPFVLFKFARNLSKKHNVPYILDYRDDWNTNQINQPHTFNQKIIKLYSSVLERRWSKNALFFTTVSEEYKKRIEQFTGIKGTVIMNGYFEKTIRPTKRDTTKKLRFLYSGTLYKGQDISVFMTGFKLFTEKYGNVAEVLFVGAGFDADQRKMIGKFISGESVVLLPRVPQDEMYRLYDETDVFLLFAYSDFKGIPSTKIFEYISYEKPILLCGSDNDILESLLRETGTGLIANNSGEIFNELERIYTSPNHIISPNSMAINKYSRENQTRLLAEEIRKRTELLRPYQMCSRCVMDTSDPEISFNKDGYCNHCTEFNNTIMNEGNYQKTGDNRLVHITEKIKKSGKKNKYDCIVGVGGGADSCYAVYLSKKMGLRPLAVHMDNGWNSEQAVINMNKVLRKLNVDLYTEVLNWQEFRNLQLSFLRASVVEAETPTDIAILGVLHKTAKKYGIKYIISGGNYATEGILPNTWHYDCKDMKYLKSVHKRSGKTKLTEFPTFTFNQEIYYKLIKGIRMIYLLNYIPYNKAEAVKFLKKEFDWKEYGGKHHESLYTKFIQSYFLPVKFGIDYRRATFSSKICSGQLTREDALMELENPPFYDYEINELKEYVSKKLAISIKELEQIIEFPSKAYRDYPNNERLLTIIYNAYKLFRRLSP